MIHDPLPRPSAPGVRAAAAAGVGSRDRSSKGGAPAAPRVPTEPDGTKWAGLDDATAAEFVRRRLVDLPTPGTPPLRLGRHVVLAIDLGDGRHCHEIRFIA